VQLLATGVQQQVLDAATSAVAGSIFPGGQPGAPQPSATDGGASAAAVSITFPDQEQTFTVTSEQIDVALATIRPRSVAVWACTDDRRSIEVTTQAPGAVSSDVATGSCKIVGSSLANDGVSWKATVTIGALRAPSLLPVAIATSVVLVLLTLGIAVLRGRAASREAARSVESSEPSVH
jgi:hypothetical protein